MAYIREVPPSVRHPRSRFRVYHETKQGEVKVGEYESKRAAERTRDSVNRHGLEAVLHPNQTEAGGEAAEPAPPPPPTAVAGNEKAQTPFGQYLADKWWPAWKPAHPDSAQGTRYKLNKRVIPRFGNIPLGDLDADTIGRWRGEMVAEQLSPRTVNTYVSLVGTILNAAVDNSYLERSPLLRRSGAGRVPNVKNLPADAREVWLTRAQLNTLASTIAARYRALVLVAALTGLRWGELIALRWGDLHLDAPFDDGAVQGVGRVRITKAVSDPSRSGKGRQRGPKTKAGRREIALDQETGAALTAHRKLVGDEDDELVFTSPGGSRGNGGQLSSSNFARVWKEADGLRACDRTGPGPLPLSERPRPDKRATAVRTRSSSPPRISRCRGQGNSQGQSPGFEFEAPEGRGRGVEASWTRTGAVVPARLIRLRFRSGWPGSRPR